MDSLRILEVLTSNHLELSSNRAAIEQEKAAVEEFEAEGMWNKVCMGVKNRNQCL